MRSRCDIDESSGERTLAACWSPHFAATNFLEMQNYSFGQEFRESSLRQNAAATQTWSGKAGLANQHAGSVRCQEPESPRKLRCQ
jgi:hypothetical protein